MKTINIGDCKDVPGKVAQIDKFNKDMKDYWRHEWISMVDERDEARAIARKLYAENKRLKAYIETNGQFVKIDDDENVFIIDLVKQYKEALGRDGVKKLFKEYIEFDRQQRITDGMSR